jgi:hypothetical protein
MSNETLLEITGPGIAPYSARGITQTLATIQAAQNMRRTINGTLLDISASQFRKYASNISCADQLAPAFDGLWPGQALTVHCVAELSYKTLGGSPSRPAVPGSSRTEGAYTYYRPILQMRVVSPSMSADEYAAQNQWSIDLEEI